MSSDRGKSRRSAKVSCVLRTLKEKLRNNEVSEFAAWIKTCNHLAELLDIREQKMLLAPTTPDAFRSAADAYREGILRLADQEHAQRELNYVLFSEICWGRFRGYTAAVTDLKRVLNGLALADLLEITDGVALEIVRGGEEGLAKVLAAHQGESVERLTEISEYYLHEYNGLKNEAFWALFRAVNEAANSAQFGAAKRATRKQKDIACSAVRALQLVGFAWNNLGYLYDKVSFGEWYISAISADAKPSIRFETADERAEKAKILGIRRYIVQANRHGFNNESGPDDIMALAVKFAENAVRFEVTRFHLRTDERALREDLKKVSALISRSFNFEDELLFSAAQASSEVRTTYLVAICLCAATAGVMVATAQLSRAEGARIREQGLPLSFFRTQAENVKSEPKLFEKVLREIVTPFPSKHFFSLVKWPFILHNGAVKLLACSSPAKWTGFLRAQFIKGGDVGKKYGSVWEMECVKIFESFGWKILAHGLKLKDGKTVVTDIDIVVTKQPLVLLIQCKAMGIPGDTVYEHWLARSKIREGGNQATIAMEYFTRNPSRLDELLARGGMLSSSAKLQPLILTSSYIFSGWNPDGIPVASLGNIISILRGSTVIYHDNHGHQLGEKQIVHGMNATPDEVLSLLKKPIDWIIAPAAATYTHRHVDHQDMIVWLPELTPPAPVRANLTSGNITWQG